MNQVTRFGRLVLSARKPNDATAQPEMLGFPRIKCGVSASLQANIEAG